MLTYPGTIKPTQHGKTLPNGKHIAYTEGTYAYLSVCEGGSFGASPGTLNQFVSWLSYVTEIRLL